MKNSIRSFKSPDGERFSVLVDEQGMPLYYPTLFATWTLRARSVAANTITNALNALKALFAWEAHLGFDLESAFGQGTFLDENQVRDLTDFLQRSLINKKSNGLVSFNRRPKVVSPSVHYYRLSVAANYVEFLARQVSPSSADVRQIERMANMIKANRPARSSKSVPDRDEIHLSVAVIETLEEALKPGSPNNPAKEYGVQLRNALMFLILRLTGIRRGELLNLRIEDIDFGINTLTISRRPDAKGDTRKFQPVVKTRPRAIRIEPALVARIQEYVLNQRSKLPRAKKHGYLFVTHKSGPSEGAPLSITAFQKWMREISSLVVDAGFHAHALRHNWNYEFSRRADARKMGHEEEAKIRSYFMGWSPTSGTANTYNRRHIKEKAQEISLELQRGYMNKPNRAVRDE